MIRQVSIESKNEYIPHRIGSYDPERALTIAANFLDPNFRMKKVIDPIEKESRRKDKAPIVTDHHTGRHFAYMSDAARASGFSPEKVSCDCKGQNVNPRFSFFGKPLNKKKNECKRSVITASGKIYESIIDAVNGEGIADSTVYKYISQKKWRYAE